MPRSWLKRCARTANFQLPSGTGIFIQMLADQAAWKKWAGQAAPLNPPSAQFRFLQ